MWPLQLDHRWQLVLFIFSRLVHTYRNVVRDMQIMDLSSRQVIQPAVYHFARLLHALWIKPKDFECQSCMNVTSRSYKCGCILSVNACACAQETYKELSPPAVLTITGCWSYSQSTSVTHFINSPSSRLSLYQSSFSCSSLLSTTLESK